MLLLLFLFLLCVSVELSPEHISLFIRYVIFKSMRLHGDFLLIDWFLYIFFFIVDTVDFQNCVHVCSVVNDLQHY